MNTFSLKAVVLLFMAGLILISGSIAWADVYRWVDENGDVHYSESLPSDFEDRKHDVFTSKGTVKKRNVTNRPPPPKPQKPKKKKGELPRDKSGLKRPEPLYPPAELQRRLDAMLLLRYETEQDLIDAMNVEISQLAYDERLIRTSLNSVVKTFRANTKEAGDRQRAGLEVPKNMNQTLDQLWRRVAQNRSSLKFLKQRELEIRSMFDDERARYRRLAAEQEEAENS
jgi:hypothetical protein